MPNMQKNTFVSFISRYILGGMVNSVTLSCTNGELCTMFISADATIIGDVTMDNFQYDFGQSGIYDTANLVKYIGVLNNDINFVVKQGSNSHYAEAFTFSDSSTEVEYILSNPAIIPRRPDTLIGHSADISFKLEKEFVSKFIKAVSSFSVIEKFTIKYNATKDKYIIELSSGGQRSNKIKFDIEVQNNNSSSHTDISFPTKQFKEILNANKDMSDGVINIFYDGIMHVQINSCIENNTYRCNYYVGAETKPN